MSIRGNKPVGRAARILMALSACLILAAIVLGIIATRNQRAFPARGSTNLPGQAAKGSAGTGIDPATH